MTSDDNQVKLDLLKFSYQEVLDATKHQDDKIGRFLGAIAFLTAGTIAFGTRPELLTSAFEIDPGASPIALPRYLLAIFIGLISLSIVLLISGLGAVLHRPSPGASPRSYLFFFDIADLPRADWEAVWREPPETVRDRILEQLPGEIQNIAQRAKKKYIRTSWAGGLLQVAVMFLVLAASLIFLSELFGRNEVTVPWSTFPKVIVGLVLGLFALLLALDYLRFEPGAETRNREWYVRLTLLIAVPAYAIACVIRFGSLKSWGGIVAWEAWGSLAVVLPPAVILVLGWPVWQALGSARLGKLLAVLTAALFSCGPLFFVSINRLNLGHLIFGSLSVLLVVALRLFRKPPSPVEKPRITNDQQPKSDPG
jgi:hypothetical protein